MATISQTNNEMRLMDHFPRVTSQCKEPAKTFFQCFTQRGTKQSANDAQAGNRGLQQCLDGKILLTFVLKFKILKSRPSCMMDSRDSGTTLISSVMI